ncbi:MAG: hypothetical protein M1819_003189 [Sarea resinae]|nr:MAG: hypothetical protein M1819_003189 [Sarea resinae]
MATFAKTLPPRDATGTDLLIPSTPHARKSTFSHSSYAAFRPSYPPSLYNAVLSYHRGPRTLLVDLGTGHGLVAREFSKHFDHVLGTDPSKGMIATAKSLTPAGEFPNVEFREAVAEDLPFLQDGSVDMIVAGQAAHWFNYARLFPELKRVVRKGGSITFWGYKDPAFVDYPKATKVLDDYAYGKGRDRMGDYWSQPGRSIVQNKLRDIKPPPADWEDIQRIEYEPGSQGPRSGEGTLFMHRATKLGALKDYVRTWSAFHSWQEANPDRKRRSEGGPGDLTDDLLDDIVASEKEFREAENWEEKEVEMEWGSGILLARKK